MSICKENIYQLVFNKYSQYLRNFLFYKCGDLEMAEDLSQDAFIKLWDNCSKVPQEKAKSFLFTVANNLLINKMNHRKVVLKFQNRTQEHQGPDDPQFLLEHQEFKKKLEQAISNLPEKQRMVFLLNRIEKKPYREIAEDLEISQKAVEKRMHNALSALRKIHSTI